MQGAAGASLEEYAVDETATRMAETFSRALLQAADELFGKVAEAHHEQLKTQAQFFEIKLSHSRKASQMTVKEDGRRLSRRTAGIWWRRCSPRRLEATRRSTR